MRLCWRTWFTRCLQAITRTSLRHLTSSTKSASPPPGESSLLLSRPPTSCLVGYVSPVCSFFVRISLNSKGKHKATNMFTLIENNRPGWMWRVGTCCWSWCPSTSRRRAGITSTTTDLRQHSSQESIPEAITLPPLNGRPRSMPTTWSPRVRLVVLLLPPFKNKGDGSTKETRKPWKNCTLTSSYSFVCFCNVPYEK